MNQTFCTSLRKKNFEAASSPPQLQSYLPSKQRTKNRTTIYSTGIDTQTRGSHMDTWKISFPLELPATQTLPRCHAASGLTLFLSICLLVFSAFHILAGAKKKKKKYCLAATLLSIHTTYPPPSNSSFVMVSPLAVFIAARASSKSSRIDLPLFLMYSASRGHCKGNDAAQRKQKQQIIKNTQKHTMHRVSVRVVRITIYIHIGNCDRHQRRSRTLS